MGRKKWQIDTALKFWRLTHWAKRVGHLPGLKQAAGLIAGEQAFQASFVPVGEDLAVPASVVAPRELLAEYIERACNRTIINECPCRKGEGCSDYPRDLGCMLLGEASLGVHPSVGRRATVEEGLAHLDRALDAGLLPLIGHIRIDRVVFGLKDFQKLLTVCFCCPCCCVVRSEMGGLVDAYPRSLVRLEGVLVEAGDGCTECGACLTACPIGNVSLREGLAVIGERCLGCGACVAACTPGALSMTIAPDARLREDLARRVGARGAR